VLEILSLSGLFQRDGVEFWLCIFCCFYIPLRRLVWFSSKNLSSNQLLFFCITSCDEFLVQSCIFCLTLMISTLFWGSLADDRGHCLPVLKRVCLAHCHEVSSICFCWCAEQLYFYFISNCQFFSCLKYYRLVIFVSSLACCLGSAFLKTCDLVFLEQIVRASI